MCQRASSICLDKKKGGEKTKELTEGTRRRGDVWNKFSGCCGGIAEGVEEGPGCGEVGDSGCEEGGSGA